jgi:hypothetical protein
MDRQQTLYTAMIAVMLALVLPVAYAEGSRQREADAEGKPREGWRGWLTLALCVVFVVGLTGAIVGIKSVSAPSWLEVGVIACVALLLPGTGSLVLHRIVRPSGRLRKVVILATVGGGIGFGLALGLGHGHIEQLSGPYVITGTCADLSCGLRQHVAPSTEASFAGAPLIADGTLVFIRCQTYGEPAYRHRGHEASLVWDLLKDRRYVTDMFVSTRSNGKLDPAIRRCPRRA